MPVRQNAEEAVEVDVYAPFAVAVLSVRAARIGRIKLFSDPRVLERFGVGTASRR